MSPRLALFLFLFMVCHSVSWSKDYYVDGENGANANSGTTWGTSKKTILSAYSVATDGDRIHVADGIYGKISVNGEKHVTIVSKNGAGSTFIDGESASRCVGVFFADWSTPDTNTIFSGFTIRNGYREGSGAGAYGATFNNCIFINNHATRSGGAAYGSVLENCLIISNSAANCAGAVSEGTMRSCEIYSNCATNSGGAFYGGKAENCVIAGNSCGRYGGGAYETVLLGCTVFANSAGLGAGGAYDVVATNSIIWANMMGREVSNWSEGSFGYCVTKPRAVGEGNVAEDPLLFSVEGLDGRICIGSPCLDAGCNRAVNQKSDIAGNERIQNGTVDIGAYEGVVDDGGTHVPGTEKLIEVRPGVSSSFSLNGSSAFVFGVSSLMANDFKETNTDGVLCYENTRIIDAEKELSAHDDDLWCQQLTEVNLSVWSGWAGYVGFTDEDDMAEFLRENPTFAESTNILKWVIGRSDAAYNSYVSWSWATDVNSLVSTLVARTANADRWAYLQLDWVSPDTTNIIGSHAVTCCGYALAQGTDGSKPTDLTGLFIVDSDNDKRTGDGGRYAPNTISFIPARYNTSMGKLFLDFPDACGMVRFLCYLKARPCNDEPVVTSSTPAAVPYEWLRHYGLFDPKGTGTAEEAAFTIAKNGHNRVWECYVAGINPTNEAARFTAKIELKDGAPVVTWDPNLNTNGIVRIYKVYGNRTLDNGGAWQYPTNSLHRFFKVKAEMP